MKKIYVIKKYVIAESAEEAIKLSKNKPVDDCWVDDDSHKIQLQEIIKNNIGFTYEETTNRNNKKKISKDR